MPDELVISWDKFKSLCERLEAYLTLIECDALIIVERGGAYILGELKKDWLYYFVQTFHYKNRKRQKEVKLLSTNINPTRIRKCSKIAIVDDICETGETFKFVENYIHNINPKCKVFSVCLLHKKVNEFKPNFAVEITPAKKWIVLPYDEDLEQDEKVDD